MGDTSGDMIMSRIEQLGRYGENWHQKAWKQIYEGQTSGPSALTAEQVHGSSLGFNNYRDAQAAIDLAYETEDPAVVVIKHLTSCGYATDRNQTMAFEGAWQGDPEASFGSVIGMNRPLQLETARAFTERLNPDGKRGWFIEVIIAPDFDQDALEYIKGKETKRGLRLLKAGYPQREAPALDRYILEGGELVQERDSSLYLLGENSVRKTLNLQNPVKLQDENSGKDLVVGVVTETRPYPIPGLFDFATRAVKHLKSNAISIARKVGHGRYQLIGHGTGQTQRSRAAKHAVDLAVENLTLEYHIGREKSEDYECAMLESQINEVKERLGDSGANNALEYVRYELKRAVAGSDAFMPFPDTVHILGKAGVGNIIQPGGSNKDADCIAAANSHDMAMVFTGRRHFRH